MKIVQQRIPSITLWYIINSYLNAKSDTQQRKIMFNNTDLCIDKK
jgi:hypothetical protein